MKDLVLRTVVVTCLGAGISSCGDAGALATGDLPRLTSAGVHERIDALRGTPLLVNFWAMWCPPCVAELPDLDKVAAEMKSHGGSVVAINLEPIQPTVDVDEAYDRVPRFLARRDLSLETWFCEDRNPLSLWQGFELPRVPQGIPVTLAIDREGEVVGTHIGQATLRQMRELMETALK